MTPTTTSGARPANSAKPRDQARRRPRSRVLRSINNYSELQQYTILAREWSANSKGAVRAHELRYAEGTLRVHIGTSTIIHSNNDEH